MKLPNNMDKLFRSNNSSVHKPESITDNYKKYESIGMENKRIIFKSIIPVQNSIKCQQNVECKITTNVLQAEKPEMETFATSSVLIAQEIKMKAGLSAQDIFRLRVPKPRNAIERICNDCMFYPVHEPRHRMPLVVLDLDSLGLINDAIVPSNGPTILDFLECAYKHFDTAIWSSVQMSDLVPKLELFELFKIKNNFKIHFILDKTSMTQTYFTGCTMVKDIEVVWNMFSQYNEHNSIMVNDYLKEKINTIDKSKQNELVNEPDLKGVIEFLAGIIRSRKSLLALNTLMSQRYN